MTETEPWACVMAAQVPASNVEGGGKSSNQIPEEEM